MPPGRRRLGGRHGLTGPWQWSGAVNARTDSESAGPGRPRASASYTDSEARALTRPGRSSWPRQVGGFDEAAATAAAAAAAAAAQRTAGGWPAGPHLRGASLRSSELKAAAAAWVRGGDSARTHSDRRRAARITSLHLPPLPPPPSTAATSLYLYLVARG